ncbi:uncharacterized protein [Glycine max]|uniref:uncharacterized protein n=1 Tax=Glycine max TaxID=3847 RepID=UPI001B355002|nr:uncharacterized protein LOC121174569 [Glycine max]
MVGNDQNLECTSICERVSIIIQDIIFTMDLYVLPISGANVVLGVQWFKILGPEDASYFHIAVLTEDPASTPAPDLPLEIQDLLAKFATLFQNPQGLPPARDIDHHIHLIPHFTLVNVRPYRYPHYQKHEIELQVEYLGHMVSQKGVEPVASKVEAIHQWPVPQSIRAVQSFLGLVGFYRRFIRGYATIAASLIRITIVKPFKWTSQAQLAFEQLKAALSTTLILALPDFQLPFTIEMDASNMEIGVVRKYETQTMVGLLCPLPVPHQPWEDLSLDFIVGLPTYHGNTTILVVVDHFSKGIHLGMLPSAHTAHMVASLFIDMVVKIHGVP